MSQDIVKNDHGYYEIVNKYINRNIYSELSHYTFLLDMITCSALLIWIKDILQEQKQKSNKISNYIKNILKLPNRNVYVYHLGSLINGDLYEYNKNNRRGKIEKDGQLKRLI